MTKTSRTGALLVALLAILVAVPAFADDDPPGRVARLKYSSGEVSIQPGGVNEWVAASINRPLTTSDRVWADKGSRAELHLGTGAIRIADETSVTLSNISDNTVQVELHQGTLNLRVRKLYSGEIYEVDTPNLAFTITKTGEYRFDVDSNADTTVVTVWKGRGEATGEGRSVRVESGDRVRFTAGTSLAHDAFVSARPDGFDDWCRVRDKREDGSYSARYVSPGVIGYEDLDDYGRWAYYPEYGRVWVPVVASGWAPYSYGRWVWVRPWGWTWVDDSPWGFAPFHYGRWVHHRGYWGWVPGPYSARAIYAPALVGWVGGGSWGLGLSFGGPSIGWFPLGYREPYLPYYRTSRNYFRNVNVSNTRITNITYITNNYYGDRTHINNIRYANRNVPGAVVAARHDALVNSERIDRVGHRLDNQQLRDATVTANVNVRPTRNTVLGGNEGPRNVPADRVSNRGVVTRISPPARTQQQFDRGADNADRTAPGHVARPMDTPQRGNAVAERPERVVPRPGARDAMERGGQTNSRVIERPVTRQSADDNSSRMSDRVPRPGSRGSDRAPEMRGNQDVSRGTSVVPRPSGNGAVRERADAADSRPTQTGRDSVSVPRPSEPVRGNADVVRESPRSQERTVPRPTESVRGNADVVRESPRGEERAVPRPTERPVQEDRSAPRDSIVRPNVESSSKYDTPRRESESYAPRASREVSGGSEGRGRSVDVAPRSSAPSGERAPSSHGGGGGGRESGGNSGGSRHVSPPSHAGNKR